MAAFIALSTFISLGYFIGIKNSCLVPSVAIRFLDKRVKFAALRQDILGHDSLVKEPSEVCWKVHLVRFAGPCGKVVYEHCLSNHFSWNEIDLYPAPHITRTLSGDPPLDFPRSMEWLSPLEG
jgi:hypothetical protein